MKNYNKPRWADEEHKYLCSSLYDGVELKNISYALPNRTENAIIRRVLNLGYRSETVDGNKMFYRGVKHRNRKMDDTVEVTLNTASTDAIHNVSNSILSENHSNATNKNAIYLALKILDDNSLKIEPKIVFELSAHILSSGV